MKFPFKIIFFIYVSFTMIDVFAAQAQESSPPLAIEDSISYPLDYQNDANQKWLAHVVLQPTASQNFYTLSLSLLQIERTDRNYLVPMDPSGVKDPFVTITIADKKDDPQISRGSKR